MRYNIQRIITVLMALVIVCASSLSEASTVLVPEITAHELIKRVSEDKGKVVVVNIFASWCPPCREEVPDLIKIRKQFAADQLTILGVSVDDATEPGSPKVSKALNVFLQEMDMNYPVFISGPGFEATVGVDAVPQLLIYDKKGKLVINHKGRVTQDDLAPVINDLLAE